MVSANDPFVLSGWSRILGFKDDILALSDPDAAWSGKLGLDVKTELLRRVRKALFDAPALKAESEMASHRARPVKAAPRADVSTMPDVYPRFGPVTTPSGVVS